MTANSPTRWSSPEARGKSSTPPTLWTPGASIEVGLDLIPDTYQLTCRIVVQLEDGTLVDHYQNGMGETVEVAP